jgi:hypothetical protein
MAVSVGGAKERGMSGPRLDLRQPSGPPRRRKPGSDRQVLKLPNRVHRAVANPGQARQRRGVAHRCRPVPRQVSTLRRRPVPERSCRSCPRRGQASAGSPPSAESASSSAACRAPRGWSKSAQARARPRPRRGFHRFADTGTQASGLNCAGSSGRSGVTAPADRPRVSHGRLCHPACCDRDANSHAPGPGPDPDSTHHTLHQRPPPRCSDTWRSI